MPEQKSTAGKKEILFRYSVKAKSFFRKHPDVKDRFIQNIARYCDGDREGLDVRKMTGSRKWMRMRIGSDYRVIYAVINGQVVIVDVLLAGNRGEVYRQYQNVK